MRARAARAVLVLCLALLPQAPLLAQVRPVLMPSLTAIPGAASASISVPALFGAAPPALSATVLAPTAFAPSPLALPAVPAAAPAAAPRAAVSLSALNAAPASSNASPLSGFQAGRGVFDGETPPEASALSVAAAVADPVSTQAPAPAPRGDTLSFYGNKLPTRMFSDQTQISFHLIRAIDATKKTLDIGIYELGLGSVRDALVRAKNRGVHVRIVMDQGHVYPEPKPGHHASKDSVPIGADFFQKHRTPEVQSLIDEGFELRTLRGGGAHGIMHNKFAVFDGALIEAGSFNWTPAADLQHFENAVFDNAAARIASYQRDWDWMWSIAAPVDDAHPPAKVDLDSLAPLAPAPQDSDLPVSFNGTSLPRQAFTPHGAAARIAAAIDAADESLLIANFSFSNDDLIAALKRAKARGLAIRIVFDRDQYAHLDQMSEMAALGFDVRLSDGKDGHNGVMHNKFCVFDGKLVEFGSFNWTFNGENNNYENAAFLDAPDDAAGFGAYFERIWKQARVPTPDDHHDRLDAGGGLVQSENFRVY